MEAWPRLPEHVLTASGVHIGAVPRRMPPRAAVPPPEMRPLLATSEEEGQWWRYATAPPPEGWEGAAFDDAGWAAGRGGFGRRAAAEKPLRTPWCGSALWLRRTFRLESLPAGDVYLRLWHGGSAVVWVNGCRQEAQGWGGYYTLVPLGREGRAALREGGNVLAVYAEDPGADAVLDLGLVELIACPVQRA